MDDNNYITIPVTIDYSQKEIGQLLIDKRFLPKQPNYLFAVGGISKDMEWDTRLGRGTIKDFELTEITLLPEDRYDWPGRRDQREVPVLPPSQETESVTKTS